MENVKGVIEAISERNQSVKVGALWIALNDRAWKFCPPKGALVEISGIKDNVDTQFGKSLVGEFIKQVRSEQDAKDAFPVGAMPKRVISKSGVSSFQHPGQMRPISKTLMKECLTASAENWNELIGTPEKQGVLYPFVLTEGEDGQLKVEKTLVLAQVVNSAHSMFIAATKMDRY